MLPCRRPLVLFAIGSRTCKAGVQTSLGALSRSICVCLCVSGQVHASKASRRGLRLDHLFNDRDDAIARLNEDMKVYYGALAGLGITEEELLTKATENTKMQVCNLVLLALLR